MKIRRIVVEFEGAVGDHPYAVTTATFTDGLWALDGPLYSRMYQALHEVWQLLRQAAKGDGLAGESARKERVS